MGPYIGKKVPVEEAGKFFNTAYAWEVRQGGKSFYIDGQDLNLSNWMRYVNCARNKQEQNLAAYQEEDKIYYRVVKDIPPGAELLVLYDEDHALDLFAGSSGAEFVRMAQKIETVVEHLKESKTSGGVSGCDTAAVAVAMDEVDEEDLEDLESSFSYVQDLIISGYDFSSVAYTSKPVPSQLTVKPTQLPGATLGVFAVTSIGTNIRMGPYIGKKVPVAEAGELFNTAYAWEVQNHQGGESFYIDGQDLTLSNWMRYINRTNSKEEQNLMAYEEDGKIYYRVVKDIPPGTELLVLVADDEMDSSSYDSDDVLECSECRKRFQGEEEFLKHECCHRLMTDRNIVAEQLERSGDGGVDDKHEGVPLNNESDSESVESAFSPSNTSEGILLGLQSRGVSSHKCPLCWEVLPTLESVMEHCQTHAGWRPLVCQYCNQMFASETHLESHDCGCTVPDGNSSYSEGDRCQKSSPETMSSSEHAQLHMNKGNRGRCEYCGKDVSNLREHVRVHTGAKPYKCGVCGKDFRFSSSLSQHLKTHTKEKAYKCEVCGKAFTHSSNLSQHVKIHLTVADKQHKCEHCGKSFHLKSHLNQHLRMHSDIKPYECEHCHKKFSSKGYLTFHVRSHLGEKAFKCGVCSKTFTQRAYLKSHMKTHSDEKGYTCEYCGKKFRHQSNLSQHYKVHSRAKSTGVASSTVGRRKGSSNEQLQSNIA